MFLQQKDNYDSEIVFINIMYEHQREKAETYYNNRILNKLSIEFSDSFILCFTSLFNESSSLSGKKIIEKVKGDKSNSHIIKTRFS